MAKRGQPINRFEIQVVFPSGAYMRWESRRDVPHTPASIADAIERYAAQIREAVAAVAEVQS